MKRKRILQFMAVLLALSMASGAVLISADESNGESSGEAQAEASEEEGTVIYDENNIKVVVEKFCPSIIPDSYDLEWYVENHTEEEIAFTGVTIEKINDTVAFDYDAQKEYFAPVPSIREAQGAEKVDMDLEDYYVLKPGETARLTENIAFLFEDGEEIEAPYDSVDISVYFTDTDYYQRKIDAGYAGSFLASGYWTQGEDRLIYVGEKGLAQYHYVFE